MTKDDIGRYILNRPFVPFEFWLHGGFRVPVASPESYTIGDTADSFAVQDRDGCDVFFYVHHIIAMRFVHPIE